MISCLSTVATVNMYRMMGIPPYGSSDSSSSLSYSYTHDDSNDITGEDDKTIEKEIKKIYPYVSRIKINKTCKYDGYVECYVDTPPLHRNFYFTVWLHAINHPEEEINLGDFLSDDKWVAEAYEERRHALDKIIQNVSLKQHTLYYVIDDNVIVTPYFDSKSEAKSWITKQPSTKKFLWFFTVKNDKFKIEEKTVWY